MSSSSQETKLTSLELSSKHKVRGRTAFASFGFAFASFSSALSKVTPGSITHTLLLCLMGALAINMVAALFVTKSITAISGVKLNIVYSISPIKLNFYRKVIYLKDIAWVRSRIDENKEVLIEVGTKGFETTDVMRLSYSEGTGISTAEKITNDLAKFWNIENKGHNKFA